MPVEEDEHGSYILNSQDLRAIEYVSRMTETVIEAMKNRDGATTTVAPGSGHLVRLARPPRCVGAFVARFI